MKNLWKLALSVGLVTALSSCGNANRENDSQDSSVTATHTTPPDTSMMNRDSVIAGADTATKSRDSARLHMGVQKP